MRERRGPGGRSARIVAAAALLVMASVGKCELPQPKIAPLGAAAGAVAGAASNATVAKAKVRVRARPSRYLTSPR